MEAIPAEMVRSSAGRLLRLARQIHMAAVAAAATFHRPCTRSTAGFALHPDGTVRTRTRLTAPAVQERLKALKKEHGTAVLGQVTVEQVGLVVGSCARAHAAR